MSTVYLFRLPIKLSLPAQPSRRQTYPALCQDVPSQASGCPAPPQADGRSGDARNLTARRPFKSATRPADQRGPSTFACPSSRASSRCASSGALRLQDGKAVSCLPACRTPLLHFPRQRPIHPGYRSLVLDTRLRRSALSPGPPASAFRPASSPSVCVSGNRETQRFCFPEPFGSSCSRRLGA